MRAEILIRTMPLSGATNVVCTKVEVLGSLGRLVGAGRRNFCASIEPPLNAAGLPYSARIIIRVLAAMFLCVRLIMRATSSCRRVVSKTTYSCKSACCIICACVSAENVKRDHVIAHHISLFFSVDLSVWPIKWENVGSIRPFCQYRHQITYYLYGYCFWTMRVASCWYGFYLRDWSRGKRSWEQLNRIWSI